MRWSARKSRNTPKYWRDFSAEQPRGDGLMKECVHRTLVERRVMLGKYTILQIYKGCEHTGQEKVNSGDVQSYGIAKYWRQWVAVFGLQNLKLGLVSCKNLQETSIPSKQVWLTDDVLIFFIFWCLQFCGGYCIHSAGIIFCISHRNGDHTTLLVCTRC